MQKHSSYLHGAYLAAISIKGLDGALETVAGAMAAAFGPYWLYAVIVWIVAPEIASTVVNAPAHIVRHGAAGIAHSGNLATIYLLVHGPLKLGIVVGLFRGGSWIFPLAAAVLFGFVAYLGARAVMQSSGWLAGFAVFDALTLALVLNEWHSRRAKAV